MKSRFFLASSPSGSFLVALALLLLLATPGHPASLLRGFPLDPIVTSIALPLAFLLWGGWNVARWRGRGWLLIGIVIVTFVKIALSIGTPEPGATASYYGRARLTDPPERSLDFRHLRGATRVDRIIDFDQRTLPAAFFNDNDRFNYYEPDQPDRQRLGLTAVWDGWITAPEQRSYRLWITAIGDASLQVDGTPVLSVSGGRSELPQSDARPIELTEGPHEFHLEYQRRQGSRALIALEWDVNGNRESVGPPYLFTTPVSTTQMSFEATRGHVAQVLDLIALTLALIVVIAPYALSGSLAPWERAGVRGSRGEISGNPHPNPLPGGEGVGAETSVAEPAKSMALTGALGLWAAGIAAYGVITSQDLIGQSTILEGGQDWLTYEYYARDILLNGPLMTLGKALGQGRAFVFQPLYPYYLAVLHGLLGEGTFGPQVAHFAGFGLAGVVLFFMARALFGTFAAWVTLALTTVLIFTQLDVVARRLLSENLYFFVLPAAILAVIFVGRSGGWRWPIGAGLLMGIACLTRAPTLLIVPVAVIVLLQMRRPRGTGIFVLVTCLVVMLAPLRNYIVSGRPALVATNAGATLLLAHPPTENVRLRGLDQHPVYNRLGVDRQTREVLEFVIQDPVGYAATLVPLAAYTLGVPGMVEPDSLPAWELLLLVALYVIALVVLRSARQHETWVSHTFIVSHFVVMITFLPYVYGYRQVLPMYVIMLPYCAALLVSWFGMLVRNPTPALPVRGDGAGPEEIQGSDPAPNPKNSQNEPPPRARGGLG